MIQAVVQTHLEVFRVYLQQNVGALHRFHRSTRNRRDHLRKPVLTCLPRFLLGLRLKQHVGYLFKRDLGSVLPVFLLQINQRALSNLKCFSLRFNFGL